MSAASVLGCAELARAGPVEGRLGTPAAAAFLGLEVEALEARLGAPAFRRLDPPAEFRRYQVGGCALDLILYPHPDKDGPVVAHARYRPAAGGGGAERRCPASGR